MKADRPLIPCAVVLTAALAAGCGSGGRVMDPSLSTTARPDGFIQARYPSAGVKLAIPRNWTQATRSAPMVAVISSGRAVISLWRYPSSGGAITSTAQLQSALGRVIAAAQAKEPSLQVTAKGISSVGGSGAVIFDATERIAGKTRRVRSEHVYLPGAELVLDAYAPLAQFATVDHYVFSPVRKSLSLINGGQPSSGAASTSTTTVPVTP